MTWLIGIDEAGYGPNLGPLVLTLLGCRLPGDDGSADLWHTLRSCVRRHEDEDDGRLVVADSKQVYSTARGLGDLEAGALAALTGGFFADDAGGAPTLKHLLQRLARPHLAELRRECWFVGDTPLPARSAAERVAAAAQRLRAAADETGLCWGLCRSAIVCAPRFNDLVDRWDSKAAVEALALIALLQQCVAATAPEPMYIVIDKLGGRNQYHVLLQEAFHDGIVFVEEEGALCSRYRVEGLDRPVRVRFVPRADAEHFCVALASMVSKYVRELLMLEFNRFWLQHFPDLRPTAGYPGDASRFFDAIRPALARLGLTERQLWRCR
jgi:ribonuclease HII